MIFMSPIGMNDAYGRAFKYMANVWLEYNMFSFATLKYRWDTEEKRTGSVSNMFDYAKLIQRKYGEQLTVLATLEGVDAPFDAYYGADIVLKYNRASGTFRIIRNTFAEADSTIIYSSAQIANIFTKLMWGE